MAFWLHFFVSLERLTLDLQKSATMKSLFKVKIVTYIIYFINILYKIMNKNKQNSMKKQTITRKNQSVFRKANSIINREKVQANPFIFNDIPFLKSRVEI